MRHIDITIDFETCALTTNAAPLSVAAVAWERAGGIPFLDERGVEPFVGYFDLRDAFMLGMDISRDTQQWWREQGDRARRSLLEGRPRPVVAVLRDLLDWIRLRAVAGTQADSFCLWSQGTDFDIALLRNLCRFFFDYGIEEIVPHTSFRDCRTVILEAARTICSSRSALSVTEQDILQDPSRAYTLFADLPQEYASGGEAHDALYDCRRSTWYTWQALNCMKTYCGSK